MNLSIKEGAFVYWTLSPETDPQILKDGLEGLGLHELSPEPRSWQMALKAAMMHHFDKQEQMVRPLRSRLNNGYTVVAETKGDDHNVFETEYSMKVDAEGTLEVTKGVLEHDAQSKIQGLIYHYRRMLPGSSVSEMMVTICKERAHGLNLKDKGGLYFVPGEHINLMDEVRRVVEAAGTGKVPNAVSVVPLRLNGATLRDLHVNLTKEIRAEMQGILDDLAGNELGERAIENRLFRADAAQERMMEYESILGETLEECRTALRRTWQGLAAAQAAKDAEIFEVAL